MPAASARKGDGRPTVAVLPWGDLFADWLDSLGVGIDDLPDFTGSWMFAWADALAAVDVRTVIVAVTGRVDQPVQIEHSVSGATIHLLPTTWVHRRVEPRMLRGSLAGRRDARTVGAALLAHAAPYLATPPLRLASILRRERCAAIVCQEYETPRFDLTVTLGTLLRRPAFATFQGGDYHSSRLERLTRPVAMRGVRALIVPSGSESERVRSTYRVPERKLARIFNPIDAAFWQRQSTQEARRALDLPGDAGVVAWHGQFHPRKGLDVLLRAWQEIRASRPGRDLHLILMGAGEQSVSELIASHPVDGVRFVAEWVRDRERIRMLLSAADAYAFPSRHEGFPVAPIEAMACGLPVVATAAQGVPDIFENGEADGGFVVPVDDAAAFAQRLGRLLDDRELRETTGRAARARVQTAFALEPVGRALRDLLVGPTTC
jgi:glycosyltransferase involved in cell wall biosynthesis